MLQSKIRRGQMDRQITFIRKVTDDNNFNEKEEVSWAALATNPTVWARMQERKGGEVINADRLTYVQETNFLIDKRSDITTEDRVVFEGQQYNIVSITTNEESRMYQDVLCEIADNEQWT